MSTSTSSRVTGVDFVGLPVADLGRARAFYADVLGLQPGKTWGEEDPMGAEFETGTVTLALMASERLGMEVRPSSAPLALQVGDVAAARAALEEQGVAFLGDTIDSGVCHMAPFSDPDGNVLMLHHRYAPH
ncbi:VOC family protein [Conexibacter sp. SYSU D00693]|uniref:VOC family protein n=1 Tax=Conexibacter sp. SYSU D00693 TaxID=2812560 RepID=UPI00196B501F|nr:VOC family protein [Conexibacter sp. SYSU D00693]